MAFLKNFIVCLGISGVISFLAFADPKKSFDNECDFLNQDGHVQAAVAALTEEGRIIPTWQNYRISEQPVVLLSLGKNKSCAALLHRGKIDLVKSSISISLRNTAYAFFEKDRNINGDNFGDLPAFLESKGVKSALVWNADFNWPATVPQGWKIGTMAHEGFHFFVQKSNQSPWPKWPTSLGQMTHYSTREELMAKCYDGNPQISDLAKKEFKILLDAAQSSMTGTKESAHNKLLQFIQIRLSRYQRLSDIKIKINENTFLSCDDLEASLEFQEGIADYVSYATILRTGQLTLEDLYNFIGNHYMPSSKTESYYAFGGLQLLTLSKLAPNFPEIQKKLLNSNTSADGVFSATIGLAYKK